MDSQSTQILRSLTSTSTSPIGGDWPPGVGDWIYVLTREPMAHPLAYGWQISFGSFRNLELKVLNLTGLTTILTIWIVIKTSDT